MKFALNYAEDSEYGIKGWVFPQIYAMGVMDDDLAVMSSDGVAHDILEHLIPKNDFTPEGEIGALASSHFIRGQHAYYADRGYNPDPVHHLQGGLLACVEGLRKRGQETLDDVPAQARLDDGTEHVFDRALDLLGPGILAENEANTFLAEYVYTADERRKWLDWLRVGYKKARQAYRVMGDPYEACCLFKQLTREVAEAERRFESEVTELMEGCRLTVSVIRSSYRVAADVRTPVGYGY